MLYIQQTFGSLLTSLEDDFEKDAVKDHLIHRTATGEYSGLANVREWNS